MRLSIAALLSSIIYIAKSIFLNVSAPWKHYCQQEDYEALFFLSQFHQESVYWDYVLCADRFTAQKMLADMAESDQKLIHANTAMHMSAPLVHLAAANQRASKPPVCQSFVSFESTIFCSVQELKTFLIDMNYSTSAQRSISMQSEILPITGNPNGPLFIIQSPLHSRSTGEFFHMLSKLRSHIAIQYIPILDLDCVLSSQIKLSGIEASMHIRSVTSDSDFTHLVKHQQHQIHLSQPASDLSTAQLLSLKTKAIEFIMDSSNSMETLLFVSTHAPLLSNHLSEYQSFNGGDQWLHKLDEFQQHHRKLGEFVAINGLLLHSNHISAYSILEWTNSLQAIQHHWNASKRPWIVKSMCQQALKPDIVRFAVDVDEIHVDLNNLETESRYTSQWPTSTDYLFSHDSQSPFVHIAKNLVQAMVFVDMNHLTLLQQVDALVAQFVPIQFSIVLTEVPQNDSNQKSPAFVTALNLRRMHGNDIFLSFLRSLSNHQNASSLSIVQVQSILSALFHDHHIDQDAAEFIHASADNVQSDLSKINQLCQRLDLFEFPAIFVNGRIMSTNFHHDAIHWQEALIHLYREEVDIIRSQGVDHPRWQSSPDIVSHRSASIYHDAPHRFLAMSSSKFSSISNDVHADSFDLNLTLYCLPSRDMTLIVNLLSAIKSLEHTANLQIQPTALDHDFEVSHRIIQLLHQSRVLSVEEASDILHNNVFDYDAGKVFDQINHLIAQSPTHLASHAPTLQINGQLYDLPTADFQSIIDLLNHYYYAKVHPLKEQMALDPSLSLNQLIGLQSDINVLMQSSSLVFSSLPNQILKDIESSPHIQIPSTKPLLHVQALVDPFSSTAVRLVNLLSTLDGLFTGHIAIAPLDMPWMDQRLFLTSTSFRGMTLPSGLHLSVDPIIPVGWSMQLTSKDIDLADMRTDKDHAFKTIDLSLQGFYIDGTFTNHQCKHPRLVSVFDNASNELLTRSTMEANAAIFHLGPLTPGSYHLSSHHWTRSVPTTVHSLGIGSRSLMVHDSGEIAEHYQQQESAPSNVINILTVTWSATSEEFALLMMDSVIRHCSEPVKFWLLDSYTSHSFKDHLKILSNERNFSFEFLSYSWPQVFPIPTDNRELVHLSKLLFLDQIIPSSVHRLLYIDADQMIQNDISTLFHHDLYNRPWGFVPFCQQERARKDTMAFRFWNSGFWAAYLNTQWLYHSSALYLVDVDQFRTSKAGDKLRQHYLSIYRHPECMVNIDESIVNSAQHLVPISSLPANWMWSESWCDAECKQDALVIDLCPNPAVQEDIWQQAVRVVPNWQDYHDQLRNLLAEHQDHPMLTMDGEDLDSWISKLFGHLPKESSFSIDDDDEIWNYPSRHMEL